MRKFLTGCLSLLLCCGMLHAETSVSIETQTLLPQPNHLVREEGWFVWHPSKPWFTNVSKKDRVFLESVISPDAQQSVWTRRAHRAAVHLECLPDAFTSPEAYRLSIGRDGIRLQAGSTTGLFYGLQTLYQWQKQTAMGDSIACVEINDTPRFAYRGVMLDVSRHFFSLDFLKKQVDAMAAFKLNRLHLHLTDAGGWRLQIKSYPKLTEQTAWRPESDWTKWWIKGDRRYCSADTPGAVGGYYTADEMRELVQYAALRHITVIPEIEMPGHSDEVLAVYPELGCTGEPYRNGEFCIGNEESFRFIENVLQEVMDIFPSTYIHIGGDEASHTYWEACQRCRKRMEAEGLTSTAQLQSYLIGRVERFLHRHGRRLLGWDEIMEGGLPPRASVMSWRGEQAGIEAARQGREVVMTPGATCYLDKYQDAPHTQPKAIGGYLPLEKVYAYNPLPDSLKTLASRFLGVQGNLWTEYIETPEHVEYMLYPRLLALAETGWTQHEKKNWPSFYQRALQAVRLLADKGYQPFSLEQASGDRLVSTHPLRHLAFGKKIQYHAPYHRAYSAGGDEALTDGICGNWNYDDHRWQGFLSGKDFDVTVDLGEIQDIRCVHLAFYHSLGVDIYLPAGLNIAISEDGMTYRTVYDESFPFREDTDFCIEEPTWRGREKARYIRIKATSHRDRGGWIFTDEVVVE